MNILGIDFGEKRIGLSRADTENNIAFPYKTIENRGFNITSNIIKDIVKSESIEKIVIGLPLSTKMEETEESKKVRNFGGKLNQTLGIEVAFENELFTSQEAIGKWLDINPPKDSGIIDKTASQIILQSYLDKLGNSH